MSAIYSLQICLCSCYEVIPEKH